MQGFIKMLLGVTWEITRESGQGKGRIHERNKMAPRAMWLWVWTAFCGNYILEGEMTLGRNASFSREHFQGRPSENLEANIPGN